MAIALSGSEGGKMMEDAHILALAVKFGLPPSEIESNWSERDINRTLAFLEAEAMAKQMAAGIH